MAHAEAAAVNVGAVHLVPDLFGFERIFADHDLRESSGGRVRERSFNRAFHGHGGGVHFADPGDSGVGLDTHDERVLPAIALELDFRLAEIESFYSSDFHWANWSESSYRAGRRLRRARDGVHQLAVGQIFRGVERDPLAVAPARVKPASENREIFLALAHALLNRRKRTHRFAQFLIERHGLALDDFEIDAPRRLPRSAPDKPQLDGLRFHRCRDGHTI